MLLSVCLSVSKSRDFIHQLSLPSPLSLSAPSLLPLSSSLSLSPAVFKLPLHCPHYAPSYAQLNGCHGSSRLCRYRRYCIHLLTSEKR